MLESLNITLSCCLHLTPHFLPRKFHMHTVVWWESIVPALAMQITKLYPWPREVIWALDSGFLAPDYADTENTVQTPLPSKSSWPVSYKECGKLTDKTIIQKDICTSMCLQQHSSQLPGHGNNLNSSISGWTGKEMWYIHIYTKRYYSVMKRNGVMPLAATQMNLDYPLKWSKSQRERQVPYITYLWNLKYNTNEPIYKTETDSQRKPTCDCQGEGGWRKDGVGGWS